MLLFKKKVHCSRCGFLGWRTVNPDDSEFLDKNMECLQTYRKSFQNGEYKGDVPEENGGTSYIHCMRSQWTFSSTLKSVKYNWLNANAIRKPRLCPYFIKHIPGYAPEEHKELKRAAEERKTLIITSLLSAMIGASAAILAQLLYVILTKPA